MPESTFALQNGKIELLQSSETFKLTRWPAGGAHMLILQALPGGAWFNFLDRRWMCARDLLNYARVHNVIYVACKHEPRNTLFCKLGFHNIRADGIHSLVSFVPQPENIPEPLQNLSNEV
eukprot:544283-Karenia_brevis.AAC.1